MSNLERLTDSQTTSTAPADRFVLPKEYEGMDQIFGGDPRAKIDQDLLHFRNHSEMLEKYRLERIAAGVDPESAELTEVNEAIMRCDREEIALWDLDISDPEAMFQQSLRYAAFLNGLDDLEKKYNITLANHFKGQI